MFDSSVTCAYLYIITQYGYPPDAARTGAYLRQIKALGFVSAELEGIRDEHLTAMHAMRHDVAADLQALDMRVPYFCAVLPGLSSADATERARNLALFELGCDTAATLGALGVLDNAPLPPYRFPADIPVVRHYEPDVLLAATFPDDLRWSAYWRDLCATYRTACDIAAKHGLTYQMHPCMGVLSATTDAYLYFRDAVGRDNLRFNFDTANQFVLKDNLNLSLRRLADCVDYIHISDNRGTRCEHLPIGAGVIDFDALFETLDRINFRGHFGIDIGGEESHVPDLDRAYTDAAKFIEARRGRSHVERT